MISEKFLKIFKVYYFVASLLRHEVKSFSSLKMSEEEESNTIVVVNSTRMILENTSALVIGTRRRTK